MKTLIISVIFNYLFVLKTNSYSILTNSYENSTKPQFYDKNNNITLDYDEPFSEKKDDIIDNIFENLECTVNEPNNEKMLKEMFAMIKKGDPEVVKQSKVENTIMVLGNAGAGKTTFAQFMATDNKQLISKEVIPDIGEFIIEDGNKIGTSVIESHTLYPEQLSTGTNTSFTDTPGFSDTRSTNHEIVATYEMKNYLKTIKNIKIVLLIPYNSVKYAGSKSDFIDLLKSVNSFIRNIGNFNDSFVLIATKVPNLRTKFNENTLVSDEKIINGIGAYIEDVKIALEEKLKNTTMNKEEKRTLINALVLLSTLQERDESDKFKKINIFRVPSKPGLLSDLQEYETSKASIENTLKIIDYVDITETDIGYSLSHKAKNYINCLLWYINEKISIILRNTFSLVKSNYQNKINNGDYSEMLTNISILNKKIKVLKYNLKHSNTFNNFSLILNKFIQEENINMTDFTQNEILIEVKNYLPRLEYINSNSILSTVEWAEQIEVLLNYLNELKEWYSFLEYIFHHLSSYKIQTIKNELQNLTNTEIIKTVILKVDLNMYNKMHPYILISDKNKLSELDNILSSTLKDDTVMSCDRNGIFIITGTYIKLSTVNVYSLKNYCKDIKLKAVGVFATVSVFIDEDFNGEQFKGIDICIVAPKWEIIGKRLINIEGSAGKSYTTSASNGYEFSKNGENGLPGNPGENGGNFFGIGLTLLNLNNLVINADGGKGGMGQNGGNGKNGKDGESAYVKFYNLDESNDNTTWTNGYESLRSLIKNKLKNTNTVDNQSFFSYDEQNKYPIPDEKSMIFDSTSLNIKIYHRDGDCGEEGNLGGYGGSGGNGGFSGKIELLTNGTIELSFLKNKGEVGNKGKDGLQGINGKIGTSVSCFKSELKYNYQGQESSFWNCIEYIKEQDCPKTSKNVTYNPKNDPYSDTDLYTDEKNQQISDLTHYLYAYLTSLKQNENNKLFTKITKQMKKLIYSKAFESNNNGMWNILLVPEI